MNQHRFLTPHVTELPDPRVQAAVMTRQTIRDQLDGPPDDWAGFPSYDLRAS